jgi:NADH-ubiquinone oxidoreductase chain 5
MVVAGVYLLLRLSPLLEYSETVLVLVVWIGALTGFIAATIGLCQNDLKRVIAYSTTSQLGMMFLACGLSQYNVAIFHLVNHAFFKALLFLSAGAIIHAMYDEQDLRKFGGLRSLLPFTYVCIFVGSLSLMATPFLSGFYSKDLIILSAYGHYSVSGYVSYFLCVLTALFSALYSTRLLYLAFLNSPNGPKVNYSSVHEPSLTMALPMFILAVLSIFSGYLAKDFFMPGSVLSNTLFVHPNHIGGLDPEFSVPLLYKLLPLLVSLLGPGLLLALYIWSSRPTSLVAARNDLQRSIYILFNQAWHFPALYSKLTSIILDLGYITGQTIDKGVLELLGPLGISNNISKVSSRIAKLDSGFIPHYALYVVSGLTLMLYFSANIIDPKLFFLLVWVLVLLPDTRLGGGFSSPYVSASRPINSPPSTRRITASLKKYTTGVITLR